MRNVIIIVLLLLFYVKVSAQPNFDKVIRDRITSKVKSLHERIDHVEILSLDYGFEILPIVNYDLKAASYVPTEITLGEYKFPNCSSVQQNINEVFKSTISNRKTITFTKTDVISNKFNFGFKLPIFSKGEISLGGETVNTTTIQNGQVLEQSEIKEYSRSIPFIIPAKKTSFVKLSATKGIIRVPFNATFKINGPMVLRLYFKMPFGDPKPGEPDVQIPISNILSETARTFTIEGYITSENSSELTIRYAERDVNTVECEIEEQHPNKEKYDINTLQKQIFHKNVKNTQESEFRGITVKENLEYKPFKMIYYPRHEKKSTIRPN